MNRRHSLASSARAALFTLPVAIFGLTPALVAQLSPPPALPEEVQKFLNTPVWYFNYTVTLRLHGTAPHGSGSRTDSRDCTITGRMILGGRSSGPSLSIVTNPQMMVPGLTTLPDGSLVATIDLLVANYANWLHGPPAETDPDQELTDAERAAQDARFARVREDNVKAFMRHSWSYTATGDGTGGTARGSAQGSGTVIHIHEPMLEFDAAARKWRLGFAPLAFTESINTVAALAGSTETGIGTIHYVRQEVKTGITLGVSSVSSIQPPLGNPFIEGPLPGSFGNISYSSAHAVKQGNTPGTLSIQIVLSPHPPEEVELIIEPPSNYDRWSPVAGENEKFPGDRLPIKVTVQKRGGGTPRFKPTRFTYNLRNTTREPGVCLNWPRLPEPDPPPDFQFELEANPQLVVEGADRQKAVEVTHSLTGTVTVSCFDYGAYTEFDAFVELENGQFVYGTVQGRPAGEPLKLPDCAPNSMVAKAFFTAHGLGQLADDDDGENDPVGDGFKGDGFTLYEEYRGFMHGDDWTALDPKKKDVFVLNNLRSNPAVDAGIGVFKGITGLNVHRKLREIQVRADGVINSNYAIGPHLTDQHIIRIHGGRTLAMGAPAAYVVDIGTPAKAKMLRVPPDWADHYGNHNLALTVAHEMLHCCNVFHHGNGDRWVMWSYQPPGTQMIEHAVFDEPRPGVLVAIGSGVEFTLREENGRIVPPQAFFQTGTTAKRVKLPIDHGQHSGDEFCLMRYDTAIVYASRNSRSTRYLTGGETTGAGLCSSRDGTGVNGARWPQSRYSWAAMVSDGIPGVLKNRGDCEHQIRVSDSTRPPAPPER